MITISPGHWHVGTGAVGLIDEVTEARKVVADVATYLTASGVKVQTVIDTVSKNQRGNLAYLVGAHNASTRKIDVSIHFNAVTGRSNQAIGTEVLYKQEAMLAQKMSEAIAKASGLKNRGAKKRLDLAFLNGVTERAILIEVCFVNSTVDVALYQKHRQVICRAIATVLLTEVGVAVRKPTPIFSSPTLEQRVQAVFQSEQAKKLLRQGIEEQSFLPLWLEKYEKNELTVVDFCGLCALIRRKDVTG